jgi:hypothetical protein
MRARGEPGGRPNAQNRAPRVEPKTFLYELSNFYKFRTVITDLVGAHRFLGPIVLGDPNLEHTWKIKLQFGCGLVAKIPFLRASPFGKGYVWVCRDALTPEQAELWRAFSAYDAHSTTAPIANITVVLRDPMTVRVQQDDDEDVYMDFKRNTTLARGRGLDAEALVEQAGAILTLLG